MGIPLPSYLFRESAEPPKVPIPLEARKIHFCSLRMPNSDGDSNSIRYENYSHWTIVKPDEAGTVIPTGYEDRHDMIHGGHRSRTSDETEIDWYVEPLVREGGKLEGWLPRSDKYPLAGHCFDVIFLRHQSYGCKMNKEVQACIPDPGMGRWAPLPEPVMRWGPQAWQARQPGSGILRWEPQPETETVRRELRSQADEAPETAPETAPARESSSENQSPGGDATDDDDSDYQPRPRSMRIRRRMETEALNRQVRRFNVAQNESHNENNVRDLMDSLDRRRIRGVL